MPSSKRPESQPCRSGEGCLVTLLSILIQPRGSGSFLFFPPWGFYCPATLSPFFLFEYFVTTRLLCPWDLPGKNTRVGFYYLFQGIFLTQGSNPGLLQLAADSLPSEIQAKPFTSHLLTDNSPYYIFPAQITGLMSTS